MNRTRLSPQIALIACLAALALAALACGLPSQPGTPPPAPEGAPTGAGEEVEIPSSVLTEVAATLFAPYQATWTAQAAKPPATVAPPAAPTEAIEQPTQALPTAATLPATSPPTQAPTATTPPPTAAAQATPTNVLLPTAYQPTYPPSSYTTQSGKAFTIFGLNLHDCGGSFAANFLIENTGTQALESLSLNFIDLSTDQDLYGPTISNAPFMWTDRTCTPGGTDRLDPGYWLFAGGPLGPGRLSGHSILANFLFCTGENLSGQCYPRSVEFVVP